MTCSPSKPDQPTAQPLRWSEVSTWKQRNKCSSLMDRMINDFIHLEQENEWKQPRDDAVLVSCIYTAFSNNQAAKRCQKNTIYRTKCGLMVHFITQLAWREHGNTEGERNKDIWRNVNTASVAPWCSCGQAVSLQLNKTCECACMDPHVSVPTMVPQNICIVLLWSLFVKHITL